jgi:uncharacterized membrane protein YhaH (DUF805 family)
LGPKQSIATCLRKYVTFSGRASRSEFWWFMGALWAGSVVVAALDAALFGGGVDQGGPGPSPSPEPLSALFGLATILPSLSAGWRRMHDTGRMGLYVLYPVTIMIGIAFFAGLFESTGLMAQDPMTGLSGVVFIAAAVLFLLSPLIVLWWLIRPSQPGANAYGPNPHEVMP